MNSLLFGERRNEERVGDGKRTIASALAETAADRSHMPTIIDVLEDAVAALKAENAELEAISLEQSKVIALVCAQRDAASAGITQIAPHTPQPFDTAPRDGTPILARRSNNHELWFILHYKDSAWTYLGCPTQFGFDAWIPYPGEAVAAVESSEPTGWQPIATCPDAVPEGRAIALIHADTMRTSLALQRTYMGVRKEGNTHWCYAPESESK